MTTEVANVISKLDSLMVMLEGIGYPKEDDTYFMHDIPEKHTDIKKLIEDICSDADGVFIIGTGRLAGQPDFSRHAILKSQSKGKYYITKGESDSFGWLTGKLCTPRGIIVYG